MNDNIIRTGLNLMNTAFNGSGGTVVSGEAVKGGYFVTPSIEITDKGEIGKIPDYACVLGTLCYCTGDNKFYQYRTVTEEINGVTNTINKWVDVRIDDVATRLDTLIGDDKEKSVRKIANEELAEQLLSDNADASFTTLQQLADWLEGHPEDVAAINTAISLLRQDLTKEENRAKTTEQALDDKLIKSLGELSNLLSEEIVRSTKEDETLHDAIVAEEKRAIAAETSLQTALEREANRAIAAEEVLQKSLEDSVKILNEAISAEASAREQADAALKQWVIDYIYNNIFNNDELVIYHPDEYVEGDTAE